MRISIDSLRGECSRLRAKKESIDNVLSHHTYTTEAVKRLFGAVERKQAGNFKPLGVLADFVEVDADYERASEEFLHGELEYVVVEKLGSSRRRHATIPRRLGRSRDIFGGKKPKLILKSQLRHRKPDPICHGFPIICV